MAVPNIINNNFRGCADPPSSTWLPELAANKSGNVIKTAIAIKMQEMITPEKVASSPAINMDPALFPVYLVYSNR